MRPAALCTCLSQTRAHRRIRDMRIIFAGTPAVAALALSELAIHHDVAAVLTRAPAPRGRKRVLTPSPVHERAQELGLRVLTPRTLKDPAVLADLASLHADAVAVVAYGLMVPPQALELTRYGWFNLHFSALPQWRGAAPVQYAIAAGAHTIGTSVFRIDHGLDTGPIASLVEHPVDAQATAGEILIDLAHSGAEQLSATLDAIAAGTVQLLPQQGTATYAPSLSTRDSQIPWDAAAEEIVNIVRAYTPEPGAWSTVNGQRVKISRAAVAPAALPAVGQASLPVSDATVVTTAADSAVQQAHSPIPEPLQLQPGQIYRGAGGYPLVGTATSALELREVTPAGKRTMDGAAWARGLHGEHLSFEYRESEQGESGERTSARRGGTAYTRTAERTRIAREESQL